MVLGDAEWLLNTHDRYGRHLGCGTFGSAWTDGRRETVTKTIGLPSRENSQAVVQELDALKDLNSTHLVKIHGCTSQWIVELSMPYFAHGNLQSFLGGKQLSPLKCATIFGDIVHGLAYLHAHGIIHYDLKPTNILLADRHATHVKIGDFGLAAAFRNESASSSKWRLLEGIVYGKGTGTIAYLAPEILLDLELDAKVDVFSLGVILYEMLQGQRPFKPKAYGLVGFDGLYRRYARKRAPIEFPTDSSSNLRQLLEQMLHIHPDRRYNLQKIQSNDFGRAAPVLGDLEVDNQEVNEAPARTAISRISRCRIRSKLAVHFPLCFAALLFVRRCLS